MEISTTQTLWNPNFTYITTDKLNWQSIPPVISGGITFVPNSGVTSGLVSSDWWKDLIETADYSKTIWKQSPEQVEYEAAVAKWKKYFQI